MEFIIRKASSFDYAEKKTFTSLEEIMDFKKSIKQDLLITDCYYAETDSYVPCLLIYDDYIE